jgi:hypothetical protein
VRRRTLRGNSGWSRSGVGPAGIGATTRRILLNAGLSGPRAARNCAVVLRAAGLSRWGRVRTVAALRWVVRAAALGRCGRAGSDAAARRVLRIAGLSGCGRAGVRRAVGETRLSG